MEQNIWIYAEHKNGKVVESYYELLTKAQEVVKTLPEKQKIAAITLGNGQDAVIEELKTSGADIVYAVDHEKLSQYNPEYYTRALTKLAEKYRPLMIWVAASHEGAEVAPSVAGQLKTGLAAHCVDIYYGEKGEMVHLVPAFGGKVLSEILIPDRRPMMASVKPGIFRKGEITVPGTADVIEEYATVLDAYESRIRLIGEEELPAAGKAVEKADIVISGGLGIGDMETWEKTRKIADAIGASVGYTRPLIDIELETTEENMIGASGKSVRPKLYMAFGISGASHHVCGMKDSGTIISVNRDENAEIFKVSDYKVVADCNSILDALLKELGVS